MSLFRKFYESPLGVLELIADENALRGLFMPEHKGKPDWVTKAKDVESHPILDLTCKQLREYFEEVRMSFDLPLRTNGTEFQCLVWDFLQKLPYGVTVSYSELAQSLGKPSAVRAVGAANGKNPIGIIIPCHRVIGANGSLTGYAGGTGRKEWLLRHEGVSLRSKKPETLPLF